MNIKKYSGYVFTYKNTYIYIFFQKVLTQDVTEGRKIRKFQKQLAFLFL